MGRWLRARISAQSCSHQSSEDSRRPLPKGQQPIPSPLPPPVHSGLIIDDSGPDHEPRSPYSALSSSTASSTPLESNRLLRASRHRLKSVHRSPVQEPFHAVRIPSRAVPRLEGAVIQIPFCILFSSAPSCLPPLFASNYLPSCKVVKQSFCSHKFFIAARFCNLTLIENDDPITVLYSGKSVGNDNPGAP